MKITILITFFSVLIAGCTTSTLTKEQADAATNPEMAVIPVSFLMPVNTIDVYDSAIGKRKDVDVLSLKSSEIRDRLTMTDTLVTVEKIDSSGSATYLTGTAKISQGKYRITYDYTNSTTRVILSDDPARASIIGKIGVGLRIIADLESTGAQVDISGLLPIGLAAASNKISGTLKFTIFGMSNEKVAMSVPAQANLDVNAIQQSFEAAAKARVFFGLPETKLEPYLIGVVGVKVNDAKAAVAEATNKVTKKP